MAKGTLKQLQVTVYQNNKIFILASSVKGQYFPQQMAEWYTKVHTRVSVTKQEKRSPVQTRY
jgi:hypothetical protein